jgi:hypothetical protein
MGCELAPGVWVICKHPREDLGLMAGVYCVEEVAAPVPGAQCDLCGPDADCAGVLVGEVWLPVSDGYWCSERFEPIGRADFIASLTQPAPERELEAAP